MTRDELLALLRDHGEDNDFGQINGRCLCGWRSPDPCSAAAPHYIDHLADVLTEAGCAES